MISLMPISGTVLKRLPLVLLVAFGPGGCAGPARRSGGGPDPLEETRLILPLSRTPHTLNPLNVKDPVTPIVTRFIFDGLTRLDGKTGAPVPALAESWEIGPDGRVYTFRIRSEVSWSDGRDFDAEDVVYTFDKLIIPGEIPNPFREYLRIPHPGGTAFPRVERVGERDVRFTLPAPFPPLLRALSYCPILPEHRLRSMGDLGLAYLAWPSDVHPGKVTGTGPFALDRVLPGEEVRLRRNPYYWERDTDGSRLPRTDQVIFRVVPDRVRSFLLGELDLLVADARGIAEINPYIGMGLFTVVKAGPVGESTFLCFRQGEDDLGRLFSRKEFRQAVSLALHRRRMIAEVLGGLGRPQWSPISRANPYFHHEKVRTYPFDPATAARTLQALGVVDRDGDGVRETPGGGPLRLDLVVGPTGVNTTEIAARIARDLKAVGIQGNIRTLTGKELLVSIRGGEWDALVLTIPEAYDPQLLSRIWSSSEENHYWRPRGRGPATPWEAEVDGIFEAAGVELDDEKRKVLYNRFQEIAAEEVPLIFTVQRVPAVAFQRRVENLDPAPTGYLHNIARITVRP